jgi:hypothetical protein
MADPKTVRLRDVNSGVVVSVDEETAKNLSGFEPEQEKKSTGRSSSSSSKS